LPVQNCPECERLWREYSSATIAHVSIENKLQLAALKFEHDKVVQLTPMVEEANRNRVELRKAIAEHERIAHGRADAATAK
jgi:hypothetical protein